MGFTGILGFLFISISMLACSSGSSSGAASQKVVCQDGELRTVGVFGGRPVDSDHELAQGTVFILQTLYTVDQNGNEEMEICTGSLIDRNIVLTAAHCVPSNQNASQIEISFSVEPICQTRMEGRQIALRPAEQIVIHPDYKSATDDFSKYDMALIRFHGQAPAGKKVLKLIRHPVKLNAQSEIFIGGYGQTTDYNQIDRSGIRLRMATISPVSHSDAHAKVTASNLAPILYFDQSHGEGACAGDSGGPTMLQWENEMMILGVNSAVDSIQKQDFSDQSQVTCFQGLRSASVYAQKKWIEATHLQIQTKDSRGLR